MLRLHVATPLPCPHSVSLGGSLVGWLAAPSRPTGEDGRRRLKRHTGAQQHLPVAAFSRPLNFDPLLLAFSLSKNNITKKNNPLSGEVQVATTTAPLHTRPETMTEIFEHTKSQAKFPAERVKRKTPAVSQSVLRRDGTAWCQNLWRAIKCVEATNTHSDPQPYSSTEDQTLCSNSTWLLLESTESQSDLVMFLLLQMALNPSWPWLFSKDL